MFELLLTATLLTSAPASDTTVAMSRGDRVVLENLSGEISVRAWDRDELRIRGFDDEDERGLVARRSGGVVRLAVEGRRNRGRPRAVEARRRAAGDDARAREVDRLRVAAEQRPALAAGARAEQRAVRQAPQQRAGVGARVGPIQHLAKARMRAIETGRPIARSANAGVSAIIDPYGRIPGAIGPGRSGAVDSRLPARVATPYFAFGEIVTTLVLGVFTVLTTYGRKFRT